MKRNIIVVLGFSLFLIGVISVVLNLVGLELQMLSFLESFGRTAGLIVKIIMIFGGMILFYISRTNFLEEED